MYIKKVEDEYRCYYVDQRDQKHYTRVAGGIGFPGLRPGFLVVVAEDYQFNAFLPSPIRVMVEFESMDLDLLFRQCVEFGQLYGAEFWYGNTKDEAALEYLDRFNRDANSRVNVLAANAFPLCLHILRSRMRSGNETLFLGEQGQLLRSYLLELPQDAALIGKHEDYPAVSALGAVVAQFDLYKGSVEIRREEQEPERNILRDGLCRKNETVDHSSLYDGLRRR